MDDIGQLIRHVGARDTVPDERYGRAKDNVQRHWERVVAEHRRGRSRPQLRLVAVAASVIVAVVASVLYSYIREVPGPVVMASIDRVLGEVLVDGRLASAGDSIAPDALVETRDGSRIALRLAGGQSLRLDTMSRVVVHSANDVGLDRGGLYIDTERSQIAAPVIVTTAFGQARDVGTQFQVRLDDDVLTVGVREGLVEVTRPYREALAIDSGRVVDLDIDGGQVERDAGYDDPIWKWVETVSPDFELNGATLQQYLSWYAGQRGVDLIWSDAGSEQRAKRIKLLGSIAGTTLEEGFEAVKRIAPFEHRFEDDALWISLP